MAGFIETFRDLLDGVIGKKSPSVIGVDVSTAAVKVVQLSNKRGKAVLETYGEIALAPYGNGNVGQAANLPADKVADAINDLLREAKVSTRNAGVAIPLSASLIKFIEIPVSDEEKIASIVPIEARKYIPVPISEVMLDWHIVPPEEGSLTQEGAPPKTGVLIVAIHKETISTYQQIIEKSKINTSFFEIEIFSTARAVLKHGVEPVVIVDFGVSNTKLSVIEHGIIRASHTINRGMQDISLAIAKSQNIGYDQAERIKRDFDLASINTDSSTANSISVALDYIFAETQKVIMNFQQRHNKVITKVLLTGGGANFKGLKEFVGEKFGVPTEIADPFAKVETPAFLSNILAEVGPEFSVAIGVALRKLEE